MTEDKRPNRLYRLIDATSQQWNVLLFNGDPNHSISGDAYRFNRTRLQKSIDWFFNKLPGFLKEEEHCKKSHEADVARACKLCSQSK